MTSKSDEEIIEAVYNEQIHIKIEQARQSGREEILKEIEEQAEIGELHIGNLVVRDVFLNVTRFKNKFGADGFAGMKVDSAMESRPSKVLSVGKSDTDTTKSPTQTKKGGEINGKTTNLSKSAMYIQQRKK